MTSCPQDPSKKPPKKPKWDRTIKLPTPPPDPWESHHQETSKTPGENFEKSDKEIFEYIECLHKNAYSRSTSVFAPAIVTEEAFDHLDQLYKLMEQMLELREQNVKLHRRIKDLEHLNTLGRLTTNPNNLENEYPDLDKDAAFAQAILESILQDPKNKDLPKYNKTASLSKPSSILKRHRSSSATEKQVAEGIACMEDSKEVGDGGSKGEKQSKVSKWTKVKAAFRWEKASNVGDSKSQDSGIHVPVNYEIARYLRVPSTSDETGHSPVDSGAGISTPGTISSASSNDDLRMGRPHCDDFKSSDDENAHYIPHTKDYRSKHKYTHHNRTPWMAKMKEMIHPRNSLKKKHRLSAASDDIQIDVEFCSDNEDVFEAEDSCNKSATLSPSPNVYSNFSVSPCGSEVPSDVVERYQRALAEDSTSDSESRPSRWSRVRRAFLARDPVRSRDRKHLMLNQDPKRPAEELSAEEEIQRNYKKLQKKLSLEFQEKICEWERLKQNSPGISATPTCSFADETRDPFYMKKLEELHKIKSHSPTGKHRRIQMTREYELPPDFKKKMQEWEKIKKTSHSGNTRNRKKLGEITKWKSLGGPRSSDHSPVFEYPQISEEFRKKLEEWKQIKACGGPASYSKLKDKTPSPKLSRKNSSPKQSKKTKELHWFEKELSKIEKEKHRLERERQKFLEREERLSKLRRSVLGGSPPKKEILIHTPSGFHRFEGISRKFTQKLYEWEKAQGIAPEASTFALLSASSYTAAIPGTLGRKKEASAHHPSSLPRSKSADSIAISALNLTCPLLSGHPSSLSLNDVDELERECLMVDSKSSSMQFLMGDGEEYLDDDEEPEAVLVEVEDYEEETAEPFHVSACAERHQMPVYQRQEFKPLCESETIIVPKVRRSESARAQTNYDLMENIVKLLTELQVTEDEIRCLVENIGIQEDSNRKSFKFLNDLQAQSIKNLTEKLVKLQEANLAVTSNITKDQNPSNLTDILDNVQDISSEMLLVTDQMSKTIHLRLAPLDTLHYRDPLFEQIKDIRAKIAELRRHLSYICAASDVTTPHKKTGGAKLEVRKTISSESRESREDNNGSDRDGRRYVKMEGSSTLCSGQGAVKKRIRYRQKLLSKTGTDTDEEDVEKTPRQHKKLTRTKSVSESSVPTKLEEHLMSQRSESSPSDSAVTLFVKTTRKLFTPLVETSLAKSRTEPNVPLNEKLELETVEVEEQKVSSLPPLPPSPVPQRKVYKEVSPGIKLIMAKYNQSLEQSSGVRSGGSSGSNSPVAWRSPVLERRVKVQTEKYQEELNKLSPLLSERRIVQKSCSASHISSSKQITLPTRKTSLNVPTKEQREEEGKEEEEEVTKPQLTLNISLANKLGNEPKDSPEVRMRRIQQAKMEFLNAPVSAPSYISEESLQFPRRNRLSQMSVDSETSSIDARALSGSLMKSASAGMINVDADVYSRINPEFRAEGYVSLPRQATTAKPSKTPNKSAFSTIASKFRKVKMRKTKDREKPKEVVETLCRQSLVVDIDPGNIDICGDVPNNNGDVLLHDDEGVCKSNSWIKRSLFKR